MHLFAISVAILYAASGVAGYGYHGWSGSDCRGTEVAIVDPAGVGTCYDLTNVETLQVVNANPPDELCYYLKPDCVDSYQKSYGNGCFQAGPAFSVKFTGDC